MQDTGKEVEHGKDVESNSNSNGGLNTKSNLNVEQTMADVVDWLRVQMSLLRHPDSRHLNTLGLRLNGNNRVFINFEDDCIKVEKGQDPTRRQFSILIDGDGYFINCGTAKIDDDASVFGRLTQFGVGLCSKSISTYIHVGRAVLHHKLKDPKLADETFIRLLPQHLKEEQFWFCWISEIRYISERLMRNTTLLSTKISKELPNWSETPLTLDLNTTNLSQTVNGATVKQWFIDFFKDIVPEDLVPIESFKATW